MTTAVSILLPTVRPMEVIGCLPTIVEAAGSLAFEIVVVADFAPMSDIPAECRWHVQPLRRGPIAAIGVAAAQARGEYLFLLSDEDRMLPMSLRRLYDRAEYQRAKGVNAIYSPWWPGVEPWTYYQHAFPPFPFAHRDTLAKIGGLLDPAYGAHYADPDLGMRAFSAGVAVVLCDDVSIEHPNDPLCPSHIANRKAFYDRDLATFRRRWDHLGTFREL